MATMFNKFHQFNSYIPMNLTFNRGMVLGCVLSDDRKQDYATNYGKFIDDKFREYGYDYEDNSYLEVIHDGIYNFIVVFCDDEDPDVYRCTSLSNIIEVAKLDVKLYQTNESYYPYNRMVTSAVEEKRMLQTMFAIMGWGLFDSPISIAFKYDPFYQAFERACLQYNGGREYAQIPDAKTVFEVYKKCLKRWGIEEKEGEA